MKEYKEKSNTYYVIASMHQPTMYLKTLGNARYCFIEQIEQCTKIPNKSIAKELCAECSRNFDMELVVVKLRIDYTFINELEE